MSRSLLRFKHLKANNIADNWPQLKNLIDSHDFPPGFKPSPNVRAWFEDDVEAWLEARAAAEEAKPQLKGAAKQLHEAAPAERSELRRAHIAKGREARGSA